MRNKTKSTQNPQINHSFLKQNRNLNKQQKRLNIQLLRVGTNQKQHQIKSIWMMTQVQLCDVFTNYQLFTQQHFNIKELIDSKHLKLLKANGKIFFGEVRNKKREGRGINISKEGKLYQGEFSNNVKNGKGVQVYQNGNLYIGQFMNNAKHGQGKFYWFSLSSKNPKADDHVQYYQGQWWGGLPDGFGTHQKINGDLYTGFFKNGLKHGQGSEMYGNGDYYKGEFVNGMPEGYGSYVWDDGSSFKGDFKQGLRNGYGFWQANKNGSECYKGHYTMDVKSGYGQYLWANGWLYKGNFQNDIRNGYGQMYENQKKLHYKGFWSDGQKVDNKNSSSYKKQKSNTFKSTQMTRYAKKKEPLLDTLESHEKGRSKGLKLNFMSEMKESGNKQKMQDHYKNRISYFGHHKLRRPCTGTQNKSTIKHVQGDTIDRKQFGSVKGKNPQFVGTIASNLFVPFHYN